MTRARPPVERRLKFSEQRSWRQALLVVALLGGAHVALALQPTPTPSPAELFGDLFTRVQMESVFADSKTFADAVPNEPPQQLLAEYHAGSYPTKEALAAFVHEHFVVPQAMVAPAPQGTHPSLSEHIAALWPVLIREPPVPPPYSSALGFGFPYVVPGGRFREIYYWDSYFTMLGLVRDGHGQTAEGMVSGFADLIGRYGHVPNGTRSYYLSRSQPPFFFLMVGLLSPRNPAASYAKYLSALRAEYAWWMEEGGGADSKANVARQHVVRLPGGVVLNRYWDSRDTPRDESYREDVLSAQSSGRPPAEVFRELRSAAESGWDFSSRWLADGQRLQTIETTAIVPVDLNSLLYGLERAIEQGCSAQNDSACAADFSRRALRRKTAIDRYLWVASCGCYLDYNWQRAHTTEHLSAATLYPLFLGVADSAQAKAVSRTTRARLLFAGGVATTTVKTGQQWDRPNGWAPLQWVAVSGLDRYGQDELAADIARRWLASVQRLYQAEGRLVEKYDIEDATRGGGGGEYPLQDGFGWTNGVTRALMDFPPRK